MERSPGMSPPRSGRPRPAAHRQRTWQLMLYLVLLVLIAAPIGAAPAAAAPLRGDPPPPPTATDEVALVEFTLPDAQAVEDLLALDPDLAEYVRQNDDGTVTVNAMVTPEQRAYYESLGYKAGATIEDSSTWAAAKAEREAAMAAEKAAKDAAQHGAQVAPNLVAPRALATPPEITIQRVDYFTNYAGRFLSVEAKDSLGTYSGGPTLAMAWKEAGGDYGTPADFSKFVDDGQYLYHRQLVRVGAAGSTTPVPAMVQVASSTGETAEAPVDTWLGGGLPPLADGYLKGFFTYYLDPVQGKATINALAAEFPNLSEIVDLPIDTHGYQRKSMAIMNGTGAIGSSPSGSTAQSQSLALFAKAYGQDGGNDVQAEFLDPGAGDSPLSVGVTGSKLSVSLATDATGALASTAAQVRDAINADPAAATLLTAYTWNNGAGGGIVQPRELVNLSDFLSAPPDYQRGPFHMQALRIGSQPADTSKVGVFIYCEQHAREWVTPNVCLETAERLLRNYAIDPATRDFVDNLNIIIVPSMNPDGSLTSFFDYANQRKNMTDYCDPAATSGAMPSNRNSWGVDINRNGRVGSVYDGYDGASTNCTSTTYAGPAEASEPETNNLIYVDENYNIKFSMNVHSYGGYFMWPPGAYIAAGRVTLPAPNIGIEKYFFAASDRILNRVKEERDTAILPARTGAVADVLYSAAGNTADDEYYNYGIIGWDFETGADVFRSTETGTSQTGVGFQPGFDPEGNAEALEFASGNYGLLEMALAYAQDVTPPVADIVPDGGASPAPIQATFQYVNEPSVIYYTLDGSTPTTSLEPPTTTKTWEAQGPRLPGEVFEFDENTTIKWIAKDIKGNISDVRSATFVIDDVPPTVDLVSPVEAVTQGAGEPGNYALDSVQNAEYTCADDNSGVASCVGPVANGKPFDTSSVGFHTFTVVATDIAGNVTTVSHQYNVYWPNWSSFYPPLDKGTAPNVVKAGSSVPVKFSLGGSFGLDIIAEGYPQSQMVDCDTGEPTGPAEQVATAGKSGLSYDQKTDQYTYVWKTDKGWTGTCRRFDLKLIDNTVHSTLLELTK